jgi:hypothetical protein
MNKITMRISRPLRLWVLSLTVLLLGSIGHALSAQQATLTITNADDLCAGFTENSTAKVEIVTDTPFRLPKTAGLIFDWYAQHENATKRWNTPLPYRSVPLPWEGNYNIWVVVKYVNKATLAPFNSFKTRVMTISVAPCANENHINGQKNKK